MTRLRPVVLLLALLAVLAGALTPAGAAAKAGAHATKHKKAKKHKKKARPAVKLPQVTDISPRHLRAGQTLTIYGRNFRAGNRRNTVVFRRAGTPFVFVKSGASTTRRMRVVIPARLGTGLKGEAQYRMRILSRRFSKTWTRLSRSPYIAAPGCITGTGSADRDGDKLPDQLELRLKTDPCSWDTDHDGVSDGYEYISALTYNDQGSESSLPFPGKRSYPNPLDPTDVNTDHDGDGLTLIEEYRGWLYPQHSPGHRLPGGALDPTGGGGGQLQGICTRDGAVSADGVCELDHNWKPGTNELAYTITRSNAGTQCSDTAAVDPTRSGPTGDLPRRNHACTPLDRVGIDAGMSAEHLDLNFLDHGDGQLTDGELDYDGDQLTNWDEAHGRMSGPNWWPGNYIASLKPIYDAEKAKCEEDNANRDADHQKDCEAPSVAEPPFTNVIYKGTDWLNPDSDGDGLIDGADDQDHDGRSNVFETDRFRSHEWTNPFNPCMPEWRPPPLDGSYKGSPTCPEFLPTDGEPWAPFNEALDPYRQNGLLAWPPVDPTADTTSTTGSATSSTTGTTTSSTTGSP